MSSKEVPSQVASGERDHHLQQRGPVHPPQDGPLGHQSIAGTTDQGSHTRR